MSGAAVSARRYWLVGQNHGRPTGGAIGLFRSVWSGNRTTSPVRNSRIRRAGEIVDGSRMPRETTPPVTWPVKPYP
jgi:hypothetical protein